MHVIERKTVIMEEKFWQGEPSLQVFMLQGLTFCLNVRNSL